MRHGEAGGLARRLTDSPSTLVGIVFVLAVVLGVGIGAGQWAVVVYALSFWHYAIYALAFVLRRVRLEVFIRDAVLTKGVSLAAFAAVYLTAPPDLLSLLVVATGLLFNISAARALGTERTYYGLELGALEPRLVKGFPYSVTRHPMLLGNAVAFAGTLLNAEFRAEWWPLAVAHVLLNLAVMVMEARAMPWRPVLPALVNRLCPLAAWPVASVAVVAGALIAGLAGGGAILLAGLLLAIGAYAFVLLQAFAWPQRTDPAPVAAGQKTSR